MANKSHKGEEPVGWVTIKGVHFPKWADGTIGWQQGQEETPNKNSDIRESGGKYFAAYSGSEKARRQGIKDTERAFDTQEEAEEFLRKKNSPSKIKPVADKSSNEKHSKSSMSGYISEQANKNDEKKSITNFNNLRNKYWNSNNDADKLKTKIAVQEELDKMPNGTVLVTSVKDETSTNYTSQGMVANTQIKTNKLYKVNGKWARYKDGSGEVSNPYLSILHSGGDIMSVEQAKKYADQLSKKTDVGIKTKDYGTKSKWTDTVGDNSGFVKWAKSTSPDMAQWKIGKSFNRTSLKELALDAGIASSKINKMTTQELREMLLAMYNKGR